MQASHDLLKACTEQIPHLTELHAPLSGETVDLALAASSHQLQLSAELLQAVTLHSPPDQTQANAKHRNFKVAWIDGTVVQHQGQVGLPLVLVQLQKLVCQTLADIAMRSAELCLVLQVQHTEIVPAEQGGLACNSSGGVFLGEIRLFSSSAALLILPQSAVRPVQSGHCLGHLQC